MLAKDEPYYNDGSSARRRYLFINKNNLNTCTNFSSPSWVWYFTAA